MMETTELLTKLRRAGIQLYVTDGKLKLRGRRDVVTPELDIEVKEHKEALMLELLREQDVDTANRPALPRPPAQETIADTATQYPLAGVTYGQIQGEWDHKSTISGHIPPAQEVLQQQTWLATVDWRLGLRCGLTKQQCRVCKGVPCHGSTDWQEA